jgi:hypothetical protein
MEEKALTQEEADGLLLRAAFDLRYTLNERPEGMSFELYKALRKAQTRIRKSKSTHKPSRKIAALMPTRIGYNQHFFLPPAKH